ncbi:MAG: T9SS type A sorting domain-containing protein [Ignavibacteriaceae bacterium]|nr:T9SS type A sorting domain-containing protein [Ignavibacteria bacterium]NNJ53564.1 T9SS type A sorting domain-containing protein [Ignavibacteriaceae bacterium]
MQQAKRKVFFAKTLLTILIIFSTSTFQYPQITIEQSEFLEIFMPGKPLHTIEGESGSINIGDTDGPNIYDFTFVDMQDTFMIFNYEVSTIPILAARYPSDAHTIGLNPSNLVNHPIFYSSNDSTFILGEATIENEYRFIHYLPYELYSKFPMTYGASFNQFIETWDTTYNLSWQVIQASFYTSQQDMEVDGYGTLKLPGFDLECLRQKRNYPDYGYKEFLYLTREGVFFIVTDVPDTEPDTGFVNGDYQVMFSSDFVSVEEIDAIPLEFALKQNYPNPFNPSTKIKFDIPANLKGIEGSPVSLRVFNALGNEVAILVHEQKSPGTYEVEWKADGWPSGVYFYQLNYGSLVETKKMLLVK